MSHHMVQYTVHPDRVAENETLIAAIVDELAHVRPAGLSYQAFKLPDGLTFLHIVENDHGSHGPLPKIAALKAFHTGLRERCSSGPERTELTPSGIHRAPGSGQTS